MIFKTHTPILSLTKNGGLILKKELRTIEQTNSEIRI